LQLSYSFTALFSGKNFIIKGKIGGDTMALARAIKNKIKGNLEQTKGEMNQQQGKGSKGGMQRLKGKMQETLGDLEMEQERQRAIDMNDDQY
jgi:uncharacterized protein YjbJ (UPF0337 family)